MSASRAQLGFDHIVEDVYGNRYSYAESDDTFTAITGFGLAGLGRRLQAYIGAGQDNHRPLERFTRVYQGLPLVTPPAFARP